MEGRQERVEPLDRAHDLSSLSGEVEAVARGDRSMQQCPLITLQGVRVPETNRLQAAASFRDTAEVLKMTRAGVAWMAVGCARGAYEHALAYACERQQFGRPIGGFQLVQDLLVRMLGNITASASLCARLSQPRGRVSRIDPLSCRSGLMSAGSP